MEQCILEERQTDQTGGKLYLTQNGNHFYITIENKTYPFYELLLETKLQAAAENAFELIFEASADDELKKQSVDNHSKQLVHDGVPASIQ